MYCYTVLSVQTAKELSKYGNSKQSFGNTSPSSAEVGMSWRGEAGPQTLTIIHQRSLLTAVQCTVQCITYSCRNYSLLQLPRRLMKCTVQCTVYSCINYSLLQLSTTSQVITAHSCAMYVPWYVQCTAYSSMNYSH